MGNEATDRDAVRRLEEHRFDRGAGGHQRADVELSQHPAVVGRPVEVARDQARVGLADLGHRLAGADVVEDGPLKAAIGRAPPQNRQVQHQ